MCVCGVRQFRLVAALFVLYEGSTSTTILFFFSSTFFETKKGKRKVRGERSEWWWWWLVPPDFEPHKDVNSFRFPGAPCLHRMYVCMYGKVENKVEQSKSETIRIRIIRLCGVWVVLKLRSNTLVGYLAGGFFFFDKLKVFWSYRNETSCVISCRSAVQLQYSRGDEKWATRSYGIASRQSVGLEKF